jgi:hypothetical protein
MRSGTTSKKQLLLTRSAVYPKKMHAGPCAGSWETRTRPKSERSYRWENTVRTFLSDLRFAARQLRRNPGFTTVTNDYSRARHWCQYGNLQRHQSDSFQTAALSPPWPHSDDLEYLAGCVS